jgi:hypothetical protein
VGDIDAEADEDTEAATGLTDEVNDIDILIELLVDGVLL